MKWVEADYSMVCKEKHAKLRDAFGLLYPLPQMLISKGLDTVEKVSEFFYPELGMLHDPYLMNDMRLAVDRIVKGIKCKEKVMIFGDYDCDGITSTSLLYMGLRDLKANVGFRLPLRSEGYGLSPEAVRKIGNEDKATLIITVDNGTSAKEALKEAQVWGIDVIVTDHHEVLHGNPDCYAFLNPKRKDNSYPYDSLCGAGVAFKLLQALFQISKYEWEAYYKKYIALAAIGTIADMVPLTGENRTIAFLGLEALNQRFSPSVYRLIDCLGHKERIDSSLIGFQVAPILNAAGRIADPNQAVEVLLSCDPNRTVIGNLIRLNERRKQITFEQTKWAMENVRAQNLQEQEIIVVSGPFHVGIIGLISSRLSQTFRRPSIVIAEDSGKGSARSGPDPDFSIVDAIATCSKHLVKFGGHKAAAGLTIRMEKIDAFRQEIQQVAKQETKAEFQLMYDHEMPPLVVYMDRKNVRRMFWFDPFGIGNPKPVFLSRGISVNDVKAFGKRERHLKLMLPFKREAICFGRGDEAEEVKSMGNIDIVFSFESNGSLILHDFWASSKQTNGDGGRVV